MSEEIKEILSKMERLIVYGQYNAYYDLEKQLLDLITNLQEENEHPKKDWFITILKNMIKDKATLVGLPKMKIMREKNSLTTFNFTISINKSVFEDVLSDEEKSMLWLEGNE